VSSAEERAAAAALLLTIRKAKEREKRVARTLILAERGTLRDARDVVRAHVDHAVASLARAAGSGQSEDAQRRQASAQTRAVVAGLSLGLAHSLRRKRLEARALSRSILSQHLEEDGIALGDDVGHDPHDDAAAQASASAYAAAWGAAAILAIRKWSREPDKSLPAAIAKTVPATDGRLRRIAATETAGAFNGERADAAAEAHDLLEARYEEPAAPGYTSPEQPEQLGAGPYRGMVIPERRERLVKIWSAILDGRTCPECRRLNGTAVYADGEFPEGDPPIHPFCRCLPVVVLSSASLDEIERAWGDWEEREAA
jgi:Phage Mu protein F like protein